MLVCQSKGDLAVNVVKLFVVNNRNNMEQAFIKELDIDLVHFDLKTTLAENFCAGLYLI